MNIEKLRKFCLAFPGATEDIKWGNDLCFSVGNKMFCVTGADSAAAGLSLKCTPEKFDKLVEQDGISPAAYVGRYKWVHIARYDAVSPDELTELITSSYNLVRQNLPKTIRSTLG